MKKKDFLWSLMSLVLILAGARPTAAYTVTTIVSGPNFDQYLVEEPPLGGDPWGEPATLPEVIVKPGDEVLIANAGGCVQVGGVWVPYVEDSKARGATLFVSGTAQFAGRQRTVASVIDERLKIDRSRLGRESFQIGYAHLQSPNPSYTDTNHNLAGDPRCDVQWSRVNPQTGEPSGKRTAYLYVNVFHGAAQADLSAVKGFDILPIHGFWNRMPINPIWGIQALRCGFDAPSWDGRCLSIADTRDFCDRADDHAADFTRHHFDRTTSFSCAFSKRIDFIDDPVLLVGPVEFEDHGFDDDYTFNMHPGRGEFADYNPRVHIEQSEGETFGPITKGKLAPVDFWNQFYDAVHDSDKKGQAKIREGTGGAPLAVVVGVPGLDCYHEGHVEIHPAFAVAIRVKQFPETWAFYYRNFGKTGMCGSEMRELKVPGNKVSIKLPLQTPPPGTVIQSVIAGGSGVKWWMSGNEPQNVWWNVVASPSGGTVITVQLPDPAVTHGGVAGTVIVNYAYGPDPGPPGGGGPGAAQNPCFTVEGIDRYCPPQTVLQEPPGDPGPIGIEGPGFAEGPEEMLGLAVDRMEPEARLAYREALAVIEHQIGFRLAGGEPEGGHALPLPLSCSMPTDSPPAMGDLDPEKAPPYTQATSDPGALRQAFETLSICGLFSHLEGFPSGFCPGSAANAEAASQLPSCPATGCPAAPSPSLLLHRTGGEEGLLATWGAPDALSASPVLPVRIEGGGSLLLMAREASRPFIVPVALAGGAADVSWLFSRSDFALLTRGTDGAWTARPADGEALHALLGEGGGSAGGGAEGSTGGVAPPAFLTCPAATGP